MAKTALIVVGVIGMIMIVIPGFGNGDLPAHSQPRVRGVSDDNGRLMILMTYNSDLGDAWEWMDDPLYPAKFTTYAYRLGMNSIIYTMTH